MRAITQPCCRRCHSQLTRCAAVTDVTDHAMQHMKSSDVKLLWATQNLFSHPRFMNGASTNPNLESYGATPAPRKQTYTPAHAHPHYAAATLFPGAEGH
jgi:xylose isomerase